LIKEKKSFVASLENTKFDTVVRMEQTQTVKLATRVKLECEMIVLCQSGYAIVVDLLGIVIDGRHTFDQDTAHAVAVVSSKSNSQQMIHHIIKPSQLVSAKRVISCRRISVKLRVILVEAGVDVGITKCLKRVGVILIKMESDTLIPMSVSATVQNVVKK